VTFAEKLRELRVACGLSEAKLAKLSGVAFGSLHTYVLGSRKPSFAAVVKIAAALGVTCQAFADCDDVKDTPEPSGHPATPRRVSQNRGRRRQKKQRDGKR
jgi:transcriptional regulator with XRE-family HTH domain